MPFAGVTFRRYPYDPTVSVQFAAMTAIASRTPEGQPNVCPVCGKYVQIEPSSAAGDAPCPYCGSLLWFVATGAGLFFIEKAGVGGYRLSQSPDMLSETRREGSQIRPGESGFGAGERVRITEGTFEAYEAEFTGANPQTSEAMLSINIFGRDTLLELPFSFLERL